MRLKNMKKIYFALMLALGTLVASCDMDKEPYGSLNENSAIQSMNDIHRFRNIMYTSLRSMTTGGWIARPEIQMDMFHGIINNGNREGTFSNALITSSTDEVESYWASCYSIIANANYLINKVNDMKADAQFKDNVAELDRYQGEGYFTRAFAYFWLADHFCQPYAADKAETPALGLPIVLTYNPSGDVSSYPSRSTMKATYDLILSDLDAAFTKLKAYEGTDKSQVAPQASYLSSYAVENMQARVALVMKDYQTAYNKAVDIINSKVYTLSTPENFASMWTDDVSTEIIFRPFQKNDELSGSVGGYFLNNSEKQADYIPTYDALDAYTDINDVRFDAFFTVWTLDVEGNDYPAYVFHKFPGNDALKTGTTRNFANMAKAFRLGEVYLIAAEAAAQTGKTSEGSNFLNELRANRITGYSAGTYSADNLLNAVKTERLCELLGEGFRMSDLRRWGQGFSRKPGHDENPNLNSVVVAAGANMTYQPNDYRYTWPIPKTELDSNPNMKGQQNPGY